MAAEVNDTFQFLFEGRGITARTGQSVAAALIAAGERCLRLDEAGNARGAVCGIGSCWECRCEIDGRPDIRACMTEAKPDMVVRRQQALASCRDR
jgi:D-hydroxyproline dehydrogenase subunit gamma